MFQPSLNRKGRQKNRKERNENLRVIFFATFAVIF